MALKLYFPNKHKLFSQYKQSLACFVINVILLVIFFPPERYSLAKAMKLLGLISGDNSEVEDLSDIDYIMGDPEYTLS